MVIVITGSSHSGKTFLAQQLLEKYGFPYLSIDHLKMGLIRSGNTELSPESDDHSLTVYLWPIVREIIKTTIENQQNLIVEGVYIPFTFRNDFEQEYLKQIRFICLIFSTGYIEQHYADILANANVIEKRLDDECGKEELIAGNERNLGLCKQYGLDYLLINESFEASIEQFLRSDAPDCPHRPYRTTQASDKPDPRHR